MTYGTAITKFKLESHQCRDQIRFEELYSRVVRDKLSCEGEGEKKREGMKGEGRVMMGGRVMVREVMLKLFLLEGEGNTWYVIIKIIFQYILYIKIRLTLVRRYGCHWVKYIYNYLYERNVVGF